MDPTRSQRRDDRPPVDLRLPPVGSLDRSRLDPRRRDLLQLRPDGSGAVHRSAPTRSAVHRGTVVDESGLGSRHRSVAPVPDVAPDPDLPAIQRPDPDRQRLDDRLLRVLSGAILRTGASEHLGELLLRLGGVRLRRRARDQQRCARRGRGGQVGGVHLRRRRRVPAGEPTQPRDHRQGCHVPPRRPFLRDERSTRRRQRIGPSEPASGDHVDASQCGRQHHVGQPGHPARGTGLSARRADPLERSCPPPGLPRFRGRDESCVRRGHRHLHGETDRERNDAVVLSESPGPRRPHRRRDARRFES